MDPEILFGLMLVLVVILMAGIVFMFRHVYQTRMSGAKAPEEFKSCYDNCIVDSKRDRAASCAALCS